MRFFLKHIRSYWKGFLLIVVMVAVGRFTDTAVFVQYKRFIDAMSVPGATREELIAIVFLIFGLNMIMWSGWRVAEFAFNFWQPAIMRNILNECFRYLHRHSHTFFINSFAGSLVKRVNRLSSSFESISEILMFNMYSTFLQIIATMYVLAITHMLLAVILAVWIVLFILANYWFALFKMRFDNEMNVLDTRISGLLADTIANTFNISLFSAHDREQQRFEETTAEWKRKGVISWNLGATGNAVQAAMMILMELGIFYAAVQLWEQGQLTPGDFVLIQGALWSVFLQVWDFGRNVRKLSRSFSDAEEMIEILNTPHEIVDRSGAKPLTVTRGEIDIRNLTFAYNPAKTVFSGFSLHVPAKRKIALVSRSGEGKSTITKLLMRLYDVPEKTIFIDGQDIMLATVDSLRQAISFVPQDPVLFHRSLKENIAYGKPDATMEEIIEASKKAHCHEFISKLPEGYETFVGERGVKLSGGERQRVAIARAILEDAPLLVLDEATSALDSESEHLIQDALKKLMKNKTAIVIAHRLSTVNQMDEIIVIEKGEITERGTHAQLLERDGGHYRMLWNIQAGGFEGA
jgi:ATP-binding cassette subfamily B protein